MKRARGPHPKNASRLVRLGVAVGLVSLGGCGGMGGGDGGDSMMGTGDPKNWSITLTVARSDLTIQQGASDTVTVTVTRAGGFTGDVSFQFIFSMGITGAFTNVVTTGTTTTALLTVSVPGNWPASNVQAGIATSNSAGVTPQSVTINIAVVHPPGVFVQVQSNLSIGQGSPPLTTQVTLVRTQFTDPVTLSLVNAPSGVTATFAPNPAPDTTSAMSIQADGTVALGTYNIGVRANDGLASQATAPVTLTVIAPPLVTFTFGTNPLAIQRGASGSTTINATRQNYTGNLHINISGQPGGVSQSQSQNSNFTGDSGTLGLDVAAGANAGTYQIMVLLSGNGITTATGTLTLIVTP